VDALEVDHASSPPKYDIPELAAVAIQPKAVPGRFQVRITPLRPQKTTRRDDEQRERHHDKSQGTVKGIS
jgi:hypothetical protein